MRKRTDKQLIVKLMHFCQYFRHDGITCAVWPEINTFGFTTSCKGSLAGEDTKNAVKDLLESLKEYYADLLEDKDNLGVIPTHDLEVLHKFFNW